MEPPSLFKTAIFGSFIIPALALTGCGAVYDTSNLLTNGMPFHSGAQTVQQSYNNYMVSIAQQNIQRAKSDLPFLEPVSFQDWQAGIR